MKKTMIAATALLLFAGCTQNFYADKPITGQIPSIDKTKLEGTRPATNSRSTSEVTEKTYPVYQRLYDTTWYQTEKETDDGKLEIETEFVFFNQNSSVFEVEVENGRAERPDKDDYADLTPVKELTYTSENRPDGTDMNAWIVKKLDGEGELEYEAYWLYTDHILYITEGDTEAQAERLMIAVMNSLREGNDTERYLLSTAPAPKH